MKTPNEIRQELIAELRTRIHCTTMANRIEVSVGPNREIEFVIRADVARGFIIEAKI